MTELTDGAKSDLRKEDEPRVEGLPNKQNLPTRLRKLAREIESTAEESVARLDLIGLPNAIVETIDIFQYYATELEKEE